ncbi:MAG: 5-formyltetrahydrofolate cyclo-ligase [Clostridiales bacterium]|nr:5-formyltetrahydrofolate cyclo-ligase [Clostridiales bacterium]
MDERNEFIYDTNKAELRAMLKRYRNELSDKPLLSRAIADRALQLVGGNVMVYMSIGSEVDTAYLLDKLAVKNGVTVFAPYTQDGIITPRRLLSRGVADKTGNLPRECYDNSYIPSKIDFCITPLLGFNERGYRIGYGKGCYDRFFAEHSTFKIGLAFSGQAIKFQPECTDIPLDCCVTDKNVIYF